jgi:hypothetical protein
MRFDRREFWGVCLTGVGIGCSRFSAERSEPEEFRLRSTEPLCIFWESPKSEFSSRQRAAIQRVVALPEPSLNYDRLHWLRFVRPLLRKSNETLLDELVGQSEIVKLRSIREKLLRQLLHSDDYQTTFGTRLHVLTRHGIGFVTADSQEVRQTQFSDPHPNKILSLLGLSGITTDHEVVVNVFTRPQEWSWRFEVDFVGILPSWMMSGHDHRRRVRGVAIGTLGLRSRSGGWPNRSGGWRSRNGGPRSWNGSWQR